MGEVGIETVIFIEGAKEIGPTFTYLFNQIILSGIYPEDWKCAHIIPIYKGKGSKSSQENYKPISILSPISKLFESLIAQQIWNYLESNKLLHNSQFGFRKNLSCELALNSMVEDWRGWLDDKDDVISIFLDLSKAFDTVCHILLLAKLPYYSFHDQTIKLFESYLTNRSLRVRVNDSLSLKKPLDVGVPQGSVLGPLLFIIFINDMCHLKTHSKLTLFADDTTISSFGKDSTEIINKLELDLNLIEE